MTLVTRLQTSHSRNNPRLILLAGMAGLLAASACTSSTSIPSEVARIETAQGSAENIGSLTAVIRANPNDPVAYNVRGSAFGKSGNTSDALRDFNKAIQLNPRYFEAYANRALIHRIEGNLSAAAADYNSAIRINQNYDWLILIALL